MTGVTVEGADRLARTLHDVATGLTRLAPTNAQAARVGLAGARSRAPRRTGALIASGSSTGTNAAGLVTFGTLYAIYQKPFATPGVEATQPAWIRLYENRIDELVKDVKGA